MHSKIYLSIFVLGILLVQDILSKPATTSNCPGGLPEVRCFVDPCAVSKCPEEPKAVCLSNYCGGCNAIWLSPNGGLAKCHTNCKPKKCNEVQCLVNPCLNQECPAHPNAKCVANYCGGCNFNWFDQDGNEVECSLTA